MSVKVNYVCTNCGSVSPKWYGRCPGCGEWNTMEELVEDSVSKKKSSSSLIRPAEVIALNDVDGMEDIRIPTGIEELDRVLGGGIVKGGVVLLGGEPGAGKSTLLLQMCDCFSAYGSVLYVSGEESAKQIKLRADRIGVQADTLSIANETDIEKITNTIKNVKPSLCIIDSIQTMEASYVASSAGSVTQVKECAAVLTRCAKSEGIPVFIVGHVNKDGAIAGPKVMEHIVDTVLYLEGDRYLALRILRAGKNRYGSTGEIGIFDMTHEGLMGVANPSMLLLEGVNPDAPGSCITCIMEGSRPMLAEIQSLACKSAFSVPRRTADGLDYNRANLLIAVLEKRANFMLSGLDVYLNVTGGMSLEETAADLAVTLSIVSSVIDKKLPEGTVAIGEIGLGGEVRTVNNIEKRIQEVQRLGFSRCVIPAPVLRKIDKNAYTIELIGIDNVGQLSAAFS